MRMLALLILLPLLSLARAQGGGTPKDVWLTNLRPMMVNGLCAPQSPLMRVYAGPVEKCPAEVDELFTKCTTQVPEVRLPAMLTNARQANQYGSILAECISAHYMGGDALKSFFLLQERLNQTPGG